MRLPRPLPVAERAAGTLLWRIHRKVHTPAWFGPHPGSPPTFRFDAPEGEYRIGYFGTSSACSFVETFVRGTDDRVLGRSDLSARTLSSFAARRTVRLALLHSEGLVGLGLSADVPHEYPYARCQALAAELWRHPSAIDGIEYRSRWDDSLFCVGLFDRAADVLGEPVATRELTDYATVGPLLYRYGIRIV